MMFTRRRAYTLTEIIIVIALIGLLIALLLPSLGGARAETRYVACQANMRSIGQMMHLYVMDNDGRMPRGPAHPIDQVDGPLRTYKLANTRVATSQLWLGHPYTDMDGVERRPQFTGLGLLTRTPGEDGNEMFFCPGDDTDRRATQAASIGRAGEIAAGSYLYRQLDMTPPIIGAVGVLDDLRETDCSVLHFGDTGLHATWNLAVQAMIVDFNSLADGEDHASNHSGRRVNVTYLDGAVAGFRNELQAVGPGERAPWASVRSHAFAALGDDDGLSVRRELDRILVAADFSQKDKPWLAPVPTNPPDDPAQ